MHVRLLPIAIALAVATLGCDLDSDRSRAAFFPSGTPGAPQLVRLDGTVTSPERLTLDVLVEGETDSTDLFAFNFGLVVDPPGNVAFVSGSQRPGSALEESGCASPLALASPIPTGLTVGVTKVGPCAGHALDSASYAIVSLEFDLLHDGTTTIRLGPSGPNPPSALDSNALSIPGILFDDAPAAISVW